MGGENLNKKEETLHKFKRRIDEGKSIKYNDLKNEEPRLLYAIERYYGGIFKISQKLGYTEDDLVEKFGLTRNINRRTLTEEEIENRLLYLKSIGKLTTSAMRTEFGDLRLEQSIKKIYGSVEDGLKYFNLKRDTVRYSKKSITKEIKELSRRNVDMSYVSIMEINPKLIFNAVNHFGKGWYSILDELKVEYGAKRKKYTKENIKQRVYKIYDKFNKINYSIIKEHDPSILFYAHQNYDNLANFYIDMGLNPKECMDSTTQKSKGFAFEHLFKEVLELLNIEFKYNTYFDKDTRPDFQLSRDLWIDCKLSAWTKSIETTVEKYTKKCNKLIIVFLRGDYEHLPKINSEKVEFRKIDYYFPFLKQVNRQDLIERFKELDNNKFLESVTTERSAS